MAQKASDQVMKIPAGTTVYMGRPAKPIPKQILNAIGAGLGEIPDILEAHLPMVYIKGMIDPPSQILFVVVQEGRPSPQAKIEEVVRQALAANSYLDIMELHAASPQLRTIRASGTQLHLNRKLN